MGAASRHRIPLAAVLLLLLSYPAAAQQRAGGALVPSVGVGAFEHIGPHLQLGLQVQRRFRETLSGTMQVGVWRSIVTVCERPDGWDCPGGGTNADIGLDAHANTGGIVRPYLGAGAGAISMRGWFPALNTRAGVAIGPRSGAQLQFEFRLQRILHPDYRMRGMLTTGVGVGW